MCMYKCMYVCTYVCVYWFSLLRDEGTAVQQRIQETCEHFYDLTDDSNYEVCYVYVCMYVCMYVRMYVCIGFHCYAMKSPLCNSAYKRLANILMI